MGEDPVRVWQLAESWVGPSHTFSQNKQKGLDESALNKSIFI